MMLVMENFLSFVEVLIEDEQNKKFTNTHHIQESIL